MLKVKVDMPESTHLVTPINVGAVLGKNSEEDRFTMDGLWGHRRERARDPACVEKSEPGTVLDDEQRERRDRRKFEHVTGRRLRRESGQTRLGPGVIDEDAR